MLIRSQDKKTLFNFNSTQFFNVGEHRKGAMIYANNLHPAGEYSTKEKALKVLDMIQETYEKYEYEKVFKTGITLFETFQMPEDSEVEA